MRAAAICLALVLSACQPPQEPVLAPPQPSPVSAAVVAVPEAKKPPIVLPPAPLLSPAGHDLILEFETGGKSGYDPHPEWPGGASGITFGIGYDAGYYSRKVILIDWVKLGDPPRTRLADTSGITGQKARIKLREVHDIIIAWLIATDVFDNVDVAREFAQAKRVIPEFEDLRPNAQAAIISLGFNRGWQLSGPNRVEFRAIRDLVPLRDYSAMAIQFRKMVRVWSGTAIENGMTRRRYAEARLVETP